jgi:hypothetical protein
MVKNAVLLRQPHKIMSLGDSSFQKINYLWVFSTDCLMDQKLTSFHFDILTNSWKINKLKKRLHKVNIILFLPRLSVCQRPEASSSKTQNCGSGNSRSKRGIMCFSQSNQKSTATTIRPFDMYSSLETIELVIPSYQGQSQNHSFYWPYQRKAPPFHLALQWHMEPHDTACLWGRWSLWTRPGEHKQTFVTIFQGISDRTIPPALTHLVRSPVGTPPPSVNIVLSGSHNACL